jgi:hypothetical protein
MNNYRITEIGAPFDNNIAQIETIHFGGCVPQKINLDLDDDNRWMNGAWIQRRQRNQPIQIHTGFLINDDMTWITGFAEHIRNTTATIRDDELREEIKEPEVEVAVVNVEELECRELLEYQYNQMRPLVVHEDVVLVPDDEEDGEEDEEDGNEEEAENRFYNASKIVKNIFEFFQFKEKQD